MRVSSGKAAILLLQGLFVLQMAAPNFYAQSAALVLTLDDALQRARQYGMQVQAANIASQLAREDRVQAKALALPSLSALNQFIYTEGNGTPSGVFVANDGVHVYNEQAWVHQDVFSAVRRGEIRQAMAAEAVAKAKVDVAARGLNLTVIQDFYAVASAQDRRETATSSLQEASQFLEITHKQELSGEVAHADAIKAQLQVQQRQRDIQDAELSLKKAKLALGVLIFPALPPDYSVSDKLSDLNKLPAFDQLDSGAAAANPVVLAAKAGVKQAQLAVSVARYGYLPSFGLDFWYGINANQFAAQANGQSTGRSTLPNYQVANRQNLGYSAAATLTIPLWNWGSTYSKVKQAALKKQQADLELSLTQKQAQADLASAYEEAQTARLQLASLRSSSDLSRDSLRLTLLRYQAGEATALEVVDAQTTAIQARNALDDGLARYAIAAATLKNMAGKLQ